MFTIVPIYSKLLDYILTLSVINISSYVYNTGGNSPVDPTA